MGKPPPGDVSTTMAATHSTVATSPTATAAAAGPTKQTRRRPRRAAPERRSRVIGSALLASTSELNFAILDIQESFNALPPPQQLRLYYATRAICEAQKIAFLQSSAESPAILFLFQELFCSPDEELSPGELILELQKTCFAKGLADAIAKVFKYMALFYHNFGNYDPRTGKKNIPELHESSFQEVILSSRAFSHHRGRRLQQAMDACLSAIYRPAELEPTAQKTSKPKEATIVEIKEQVSHPFYGHGVSFMDIVRVDRELHKHAMLTINTRIWKHTQDKNGSANQRAIFHVMQAGCEPKLAVDDTSKARKGQQELKPPPQLKQQQQQEQPTQVLTLPNQDQIHLFKNDFQYFLIKIERFLRLASSAGTTTANAQEPKQPTSSSSFHQLVEKTTALFTAPSVASLNALHRVWLLHKSDSVEEECGVDFLVSFSRLPVHRDPVGTRGTLESFVAIRNRFYQRRVDRILLQSDNKTSFLKLLPFWRLMNFQENVANVTVVCVDLVLTSGGSGMLLPVIAGLQLDDLEPLQNPSKLLFIANCAENYCDGLVTLDKKHILDGFLTADDAELVQEEWDRVVFLRFLVEEVIAPATFAILRDTDSRKQEAVLFPAELYIDTSDDDEAEIIFEQDSESEADEGEGPSHNKGFAVMDKDEEEQLWLHSSFGRRPAQWYTDLKATYVSVFNDKLAKVLEECRIVLVGLLLVLHRQVRRQVCGKWCDEEEEEMEEEGDGDPLTQVAVAYVALLLREGLLALAFFSTQQFRWEDDKMLARYMVLQMLLLDDQDPSSKFDFSAVETNGQPSFSSQQQSLPLPRHHQHRKKKHAEGDAIARVVVVEERNARDLSQMALGVPEKKITSLHIELQTTSGDKMKKHQEPQQPPSIQPRSWCHRLKIHVRHWLQQIQWIQMTGDTSAGQKLYDHFAYLSDDDFRFREFILSTLGDPDVKKKEETIAKGGRRKSNAVQDPRVTSSYSPSGSSSGGGGGGGADGGTSYPVLPVRSMAVRHKLSAIRNASHFSHETIWIPPFLRVVNTTEQTHGGGGDAGSIVVQANNKVSSSSSSPLHGKPSHGVNKQTRDLTTAVDPGKSGEELPTVVEQGEPPDKVDHEGYRDAHEDDATAADAALAPPQEVQVEMRVFPADLSYAIEVAVLNIGVITDDEAANGFHLHQA